jgi:hypothetical protein
LADEPESREYKAQKLTWEKPYCIRIAELRKDIHEGDTWPLNEHYRCNDIYRFYNLFEVEEFLQSFGKDITDLKWPADYTRG